MKTNQIFSLKRFINLIKSDLLINYKKYSLMGLVILVLGYVFLYLNFPKHGYQNSFDYNKYFNLFMTFLLFSLGAWIGSSFPAFNNKNTTRNYLMLPASTIEKYTAQFLGRVVVSFIIFLIIFWVDAHLARFTVLHSAKDNLPLIEKFTYSGLINRLKEDAFTSWLMPLISSALLMFLFSVRIYFKKQGLIKTLITLSLLIFSIYLLFVIYTQIFYTGFKWFEVNVNDYQTTGKFRNSEIFTIVLLSFSTLILPVLGFFKLKEKEL